jgi:hypothetical protein
LQSKGSGWLIRLYEKSGKQHMMPFHHALAEALHAYFDAAGIAADKKAFLFRTSRGDGGTALADQPMTQVDAWRMVRKRALAAGIMAPISNHSFRATGITAYLANGGTLETPGSPPSSTPSASPSPAFPLPASVQQSKDLGALPSTRFGRIFIPFYRCAGATAISRLPCYTSASGIIAAKK